ncbi:MAG: hypothetical protein QOG26_722 [Solirubrobacterales bacterium]|nr:hypothetical protein [Solirubrobacterales bacterium]
MGIWSYCKRVITDTGDGVEPVSIALERNPDAEVEIGAENPPDLPLYTFRIGMRSGFGGAEAGLPVYRRPNPSPHPILKEIYLCEVVGQRLEAANIFSLKAKVQRALETIAPARTLPLCYFRAQRYDYSLPVYEEGSHLVCPVLTGPKIKGAELADIREPVTRWLHSAGYLLDEEEPEVQVVRPSDLRLVPPAAVIRCLDDDGLWMPTVEGVSAEGPVIGLLVHPAELKAEARDGGSLLPDAPPAGADVTALLRYVGNELARRGTLTNPWGLYASDIRPEIWARTEELTDTTSRTLGCHLEGAGELRLPIRHTAAGEVLAAIQEHGITVFLAGDDDALAAAVGRYLVGAEFLRHAGDVRVEVDREAPSEMLDPAAIWTGGAGSAEEPLEAFADRAQTAETNDQEVAQA